jgi:hypothetical protein
MGFMLEGAGRVIARYLERPAAGYEPFAPSDPDALRAALEPRDVLLVEGNTHIAGVINISRNRPGRMRRSTSVRSATPCQKTASRWCWSKPISASASASHLYRNMRAFTRASAGPSADRRRPRARLRLRGRAHRLRLRPQEHSRSVALSVPAARSAALAAAHDGARLRTSDPHHLVRADRVGVPARRPPDPAEGAARRQRARACRDDGNSPLVALCAARLRYLGRISKW